MPVARWVRNLYFYLIADLFDTLYNLFHRVLLNNFAFNFDRLENLHFDLALDRDFYFLFDFDFSRLVDCDFFSDFFGHFDLNVDLNNYGDVY
jgi:hypothetical protein